MMPSTTLVPRPSPPRPPIGMPKPPPPPDEDSPRRSSMLLLSGKLSKPITLSSSPRATLADRGRQVHHRAEAITPQRNVCSTCCDAPRKHTLMVTQVLTP